MTSSDILDTCFNVQLVKATDILLDDLESITGRSEKTCL